MKKTYQKPTIEVVALQTTHIIMAGSFGMTTKEATLKDGTDEYDSLGRGDDGDWEDEEF